MQVLTLLCGIIESDNYSDMFIHLENDEVYIELNKYTVINSLILPLCDFACCDFFEKSKWCVAKLVFAKNPARLSKIVLENDKGECLTSDIGDALLHEYDRRGLDSLYIKICDHLIKDVNLVLTTL